MSNKALVEALELRDINLLRNFIDDESVLEAITLHWQGDYQRADYTFKKIDWGQCKNIEIAVGQSDWVLMRVKRGEEMPEIDLTKINEFQPTKIVYQYAIYSKYFWLDHKKAWGAIRKILISSIKCRWIDAFYLSLFLSGHMLAIGRHGWIGFSVAKFFYLKLQGRFERHKNTFSYQLPLAAFGYTHLVVGKLGHDFELIAINAERHLLPDPYYQALLTVGCLYGYAYSGNVTRAEVYANRLDSMHQDGKLNRYKLVSKMMPLLPLALRGYGHAIEDEFNKITAEFDETTADALISSQFYRTAAIISLCLSKLDSGRSYLDKAVLFRLKTKSFHAWEKVDNQIYSFVSEKQLFCPWETPISFMKNESLSRGGATALLGKITSSFVQHNHMSEKELADHIALLISKNIDCEKYSFSRNKPIEYLEMPLLKIGESYCVFSVAEDRVVSIRKQFAVIDPILRMFFLSKISQEKISNMKVKEEMATEVFQIAHDLKSPLLALDVVKDEVVNLDIDSQKIMTMAMASITRVSDELLDKYKTYKSDSLGASYQKPHMNVSLVPVRELILEVIEEMKIHFQQINLESLDFSNDISCYLCATHFKRILHNLINNSIEAMDEKETVRVVVSHFSSTCKIEIIDQGAGIPSDVLPMIGTEGYSFRKKDGNGLGLFHAKKCLSDWGGSLVVESEEGVGTRLIIELPISSKKAKHLSSTAAKRVFLENSSL